jgi:hypothetical protein
MLGQLDAPDNALAGPNAANALRLDNVGTTSRPERKCPTPMLVVSPGRSPNCYAMKADRSEHGGRSGTPRPGHGEEGFPAVLSQTKTIRELTLYNVGSYPFDFHSWSRRISGPERGGSLPWFGLHADNFGRLPLE